MTDRPTYLQVKIGISSTGCSPHVDIDLKKIKNRIKTIEKSMRKCCRIGKIWVRFVLIFLQKAVTKKIKSYTMYLEKVKVSSTRNGIFNTWF